MRISTNLIFDAIAKTNNKDLKEVLQKLESQKTEQLKTDGENPLLKNDTAKPDTTKKLLNSLLKELANSGKTKEAIVETLKQNDIPKLVKTTTNELKTLVDLLKEDKTLSKSAPQLEKLLLPIKDVKPENIKTQISKSGVFLESKLSSPKADILPLPIKEVLTNLKEVIVKNFPKAEVHVKQIDTLINAKKADKNFVEQLNKLVKDIKSSPVLPKQIESKLENIVKTIEQATRINQKEVIVKNTSKADSNLIEQDKNPKKQILLSKSDIKGQLEDLKQTIVKSSSGSEVDLKLIDKLLNAPKANKSFISDIKTLINDIKTTKNPEKPLLVIIAKLENLVQKSQLLESKIKNTPKIVEKEVKVEVNLKASPNEIKKEVKIELDLKASPKDLPKEVQKEAQKVVNDIKQTMSELKELLLAKDGKKLPLHVEEKSQLIAKAVEQTLKTPDFFPKDLAKATTSEQIQRVVNLIKTELLKSDSQLPQKLEVTKLTQKLEEVIKEQIATKKIVSNQKLQVEIPPKVELANDIKSTLLNIKHELSGSTLPQAKETLMQVDRVLTQIDYFQLVSLSTNSTSSYLPFLWEDLEEGQVSLKKLKENRFFCEINLKLKEYGQIDLMIMLFEDIHVNISMFAEKKEFLELVQDNLPALKQGVNKLGLIPSTVELFDGLKEKERKENTRSIANSMAIGSGLNIEV